MSPEDLAWECTLRSRDADLPQVEALSQCATASPQQDCGVAGALMERRLGVLRTSIQAASEPECVL